VDKGWLDRREINTVVYDPDEIHIEEMEEALKNAETYIGTISPADDSKNPDQPQGIAEEQAKSTNSSER
jgi:cation transport regulator ChaC